MKTGTEKVEWYERMPNLKAAELERVGGLVGKMQSRFRQVRV